jgi:hypothetical protein
VFALPEDVGYDEVPECSSSPVDLCISKHSAVVTPGLLLGSQHVAVSRIALQRLGVTHVLNLSPWATEVRSVRI